MRRRRTGMNTTPEMPSKWVAGGACMWVAGGA
jgi:hypothetical protein